jgi:hypothetical protein
MKSYDALTETQKERAVALALENLLASIYEGVVRFNDELNKNDLQARIDAAIAKSDEMQTPWFAGEYIIDTCGEEIMAMTQCDAEDSYYAEPGERIVPWNVYSSKVTL